MDVITTQPVLGLDNSHRPISNQIYILLTNSNSCTRQQSQIQDCPKGGPFCVKDGADCNYWVVGPTARTIFPKGGGGPCPLRGAGLDTLRGIVEPSKCRSGHTVSSL